MGLHGVLLDLRHGSVGLLRGRRLRLRPAADLIDGDEDFSGGTRQLLNRGGQFLGSRADLLSAACHGPAGLQIFGKRRKRLRGLLALVERLALLLYRALRLCHGRRLFLGGAGDQFGAAGSLARGYVGLDGSGEDRFADLRKCRQLAAGRAQIDGDRAGRRRLFAGALGDRPDAQRQRPHFFGDACRQLLDVAGAALRDLGERTDLIGHHGETLAVVARSRRLDCRVQCQQVCAVGKVGHHQRGRADTFRLLLQFRDDLDRGKLAARTAFDGHDQIVQLGGGFQDGALQALGLSARSLGLGPCLGEGCSERADRRHQLLRGAGCLFGAGGNLFQRPPQLLGGRGRLGHAAGQLLRRRSNPLGGFLLSRACSLMRPASHRRLACRRSVLPLLRQIGDPASRGPSS